MSKTVKLAPPQIRLHHFRPLELFNWLFALEDSQNALEEGEERPRVTWEVSYHRKSKVRQDDEEDDVGSGYV